MRAFFVVAAITLASCWINLDKSNDAGVPLATCTMGTSNACMTVQPTFSSIYTNVLAGNLCNAGACHDGNAQTPQGKVDLSGPGSAYTHLVNFDSILTPGRKLVVPSMPTASYLLVMLGKVQPKDATPTPAPPIPGNVGYMPQTGDPSKPMLLCCQKLDAIDMWIQNGAMNN
jgi:hypothetical protein